MSIRIAINGYGRIGRGLHRRLLETNDVEVVAINSGAAADSHAYLLKYDSIYGTINNKIVVEGSDLVIDGKKIAVYQIKDPAELDWGKHDVDVVIESTGKFTSMENAKKHLQAGAKKVLITAPCKDPEIENVVMGVNHNVCSTSGTCKVVSNASCTTNCLAPVVKVLNDEFGVKSSIANTMHAFTYTQNLLDNSNQEDFRRARATTESIIPTTTGAMDAIGRVMPEMSGKIAGMAFRVPIPIVSCIYLVANLEKKPSVEEINEAFRKHEKGDLKGILATNDEPLVSRDFLGNTNSAIVDTMSTMTLPDGMTQIVAWYDNEWGYISRILDLIRWISVENK